MLHLFLQRQKRKQSKVVILLSQSHTVCQSRGNVKCKILVGKRTDGLETGESQKVEMEEDDNTEHEFQLTKGTSLLPPVGGF